MRWKKAATYKKLFKLLIDREIKSQDLAKKAMIIGYTYASPRRSPSGRCG